MHDIVTNLLKLAATFQPALCSYLLFPSQPADQVRGQINIRSDEHLTSEAVLSAYPEDKRAEVLAMTRDVNIYKRMAASICPSTYGHINIKQAVLLMLFGGVHKTTKEGINLRGDINVAIVGDPSCAKSQMLKYVTAFLPRAVYTSGKSSSAAGLTASVVKVGLLQCWSVQVVQTHLDAAAVVVTQGLHVCRTTVEFTCM